MNLARRVPLDCLVGIFLRHAAAIVGDAHEACTAAHDFDLDIRRAGVNRIFHKLLYDGGRPLDYLAGGYLIDCAVIQHLDTGAHDLPFSLFACSCS